jgi:uncharacterized protein (TIGR03083 family)
MTDIANIANLVDAYEHTIRATIALAAELTDDQWTRPTWLAGWNVADNVAHIAALERQFLGTEDLSGHVLDTFAHVTNPLQEHMERGVDVRRSWTRADVIADLATALDARLTVLRDPSLTVESMLPGLMGGEAPAGRAMPIRVFDCWAHEQDIRAAVGRPGNLDSPAAVVSYAQIVRAVPAVAKKAGLDDTEAVSVVVSGPVQVSFVVGGSSETLPTATITTDSLGVFRLAAGRGDWRDVMVSVTGDSELALRVLANMAITP